MFRKTTLKALTLTAMAVSVAALGAGSAFASGYGYGGGYGGGYGKSSGHVKSAPHRPFAHIQDTIWRQHVGWCATRFKTYNSYDNTYQPYSGPRKQCWSPYITG
ncbi:BA14K family protein [Hoeflea sp.]|uniref:BA14K family protein n=1 Tax=Hoeflea sp. TaxID=1940281 RepID=UPI003B023EB7